ncbi:hypothetical protein L3X38_041390 [Prunus dulcis]|uniref:Uncharacterized protein n=1 Tax=Prunus dulcis TaxID=3755 RepID=A0AAD4YJ34_PRUDU|nr:hypothetical protein L3X38_041390 [Prunus dulcis]
MALKLGNTFPPLPYFAEQESSSPCCIKREEDSRKKNWCNQYWNPQSAHQSGIDDSVEDERDLDQIMADQRAAEIERDTRDGVQQLASSPHLLHDQGKLSSKLYFRQN